MSNSPIRPTGRNILVKPELEEKTVGGLFIPGIAQGKRCVNSVGVR